MAVLQKIDLGTPPSGSDGDTARSGNAKINANTDVLGAVVPLGYQILSDSKTLAQADIGTRIGLFFQQAGGSVVMPLANTVRQNGVIHFFSFGQPVDIGFQGADGSQITRINTGDCVTYVSDGRAYWHVAERGKGGFDEAVLGSLSVGGAMTASGLLTASAGVNVTGPLSVNRSGGEGDLLLGGNDGYFYGTPNAAGWFSPTRGSFYYSLDSKTFNVPKLYVDGAATVAALTIGGNKPWDSGNLPNPVQHTDIQAIYAVGGEERDLTVGDEVRLTSDFTAKGSSVSATASLYFTIGDHGAIANDFVAYLDLYDVAAATVVSKGVFSMVSVPNGALYKSLGSCGSLSCGISYGTLTTGRQYRLRLCTRKTQPTGPVYPRNMSISGMQA